MSSTSETTQLREQIEVLKSQLAHAQRLTALGELAGTLTHEFNNILTTTINYAKMGLRHKDDATREKAFQKILAAGQRAAKLTTSVLGIAKQKSEAFEPTDLLALIEDTLLLLERDLTKYRVSVQRDFQTIPPALVNPHQIQTVVMNLIINARQAMPSGGSVVLGLKHDPATPYVDLIVRDNGSGIPADKLPHIFDAFYTTKSGPDASGQGGTGLGLATCRDIIEKHRGRIRVESTVGRGTAFTLKLPVAATAKAGKSASDAA